MTVAELREALDALGGELLVTALCAGDPSAGIDEAVYGVIDLHVREDDLGYYWLELKLAE
jgi:hypothetical protein